MHVKIVQPDEFDKCLPAAERFHSIYDPNVQFSGDQFKRFWNGVYGNHNGFIIGLYNEHSEVIGGVGGIITEFMTSEALTCVEMFWYVDEEYRGTWGIKLLKYFEEMAKASGCVRIAMAYMENSMPERVQKLYTKMGYTPYEHHWMKWF